jgi:hypothetical protein
MAAGLLLLSIPLWGQSDMGTPSSLGASGGQTHLGYPQDWSSRHLLMSGTRAEDLLTAGAYDPRYVYNTVMRQVAVEKARKAKEDALMAPGIGIGLPRPPSRRPMKIDWAVSLENGYVAQKQFPAKYQFSVTAESSSADYVLFGLTVPSGTQANMVGINNLYTAMTPTPCNGGLPLVAFAYNTVTQTGGQIKTSPTLSEDGTKVAFVESTTAGAYFHVLVLPNPIPVTSGTAVGTVLKPKTPTTCTTPTTAGCMTTLAIETTATDSNSSPWVDYRADTAYVGTDGGVLYKITPVFGGGAPALVNDSANWPVTVSPTSASAPTTNQSCNTVLTDPIVDNYSGKIFIGNGGGFLYAVNLTSPAKTTSATQTIGWAWTGAITNCAGIPTGGGSGQAGTGVVDAPIVVVDAANYGVNQVFAFTGCSYVLGVGGAVSQLPATFTTGVPTTANTVDLGSATGAGDCTSANLHSGTVDNLFWLYGSAQGHLITCGFVNKGGTPSEPEMYMFPFSGGVIEGGPVDYAAAYTFLIDSTRGDECSPLTEFYNGTTDLMFFGVGGPATTPTDGYLEASTLNATSLTTPVCSGTSTCVTAPSALQATSGIVIDNQLSNGGTNIYFTTQAAGDVGGQKCPSGLTGGSANPYCAVKLTQSGLQ